MFQKTPNNGAEWMVEWMNEMQEIEATQMLLLFEKETTNSNFL